MYLLLTGSLLLGFGASVLIKLLLDARYRRTAATCKAAPRDTMYGEEYYLPETVRRSMGLGRFLLISGLVTLGCGVLGGYLLRPPHWTVYTSRGGQFRVEMPDTPRVTSKTLSTPVGVFTQHTVAVNRLFRVSCSVQYVDLPAVQDDMSGLAEQMQDAISRQTSAKVLRSTKITTGATPGVEFLLKDPREGTLRVRTYVIGNRIYAVTASGLPASGKHPVAERFLGSFGFME